MTKESNGLGGTPGLNLREQFPPHTPELWRIEVDRLLKGKPYDKIMNTDTLEGIGLEPMYWPHDVASLPHIAEMPGFDNYVRGTKPLGYLQRCWDIAQEIPYPNADEFNAALRHDLARGQTAVNLLIDNAGRQGLDPDQASPEEVGDGGTSICCLADMAKALAEVPLDRVPVYLESYSVGLPLAAMLFAVAGEQNKLADLQGGIGTDPLGQLAIQGNGSDLAQSYDEMQALTRWASVEAPRLRTIGIHSYPYHEAGASAGEELACTLATAVEYLRQMQQRDLAIDTVAPRIQFCLALGGNFFMEIAKLRAARLLWAKVVGEFGGSAESRKLHIHARTSRFNKSKYDPYVNLLRTSTEAFSGILGGCDSMHVGCFDERHRQPDEFSRRVARNQQLVLKEECHGQRVIDPAGGSWYLEKLTWLLAERSWKQFQSIEAAGGMATALQQGMVQEMVAKTAQTRREKLELRKNVMIGINMYANVAEKSLTAKGDNQDQSPQRQSRSDTMVKPLADVVINREDIVDSLIAAVKSGATLGQMVKALRPGNERINVAALPRHYLAGSFEHLRDAVVSYRQKTGSVPEVFLANIGSVSQYKARSEFSRLFFEAAGLTVIDNSGFATPIEAATAALESDARVVVICSDDPTYPEIVPPLTQKIKQTNPDTIVVLAGYPKEQVEAHRQAGVDQFIHLRANAREVLAKILNKLGVMS